MKKSILILFVLVIALGLCFSGAEAYYSSVYGGSYGGLLGGYGGYGGSYGGLLGGYGGGYGGLLGGYSSLLGGYGLMGGLYGGLMGGLYGGLMGGMYGGLMGGMYGGMYGSMYSPFSYNNLYYPVQTTGGLTYQVPFMQIAPLLGIAGLYNQLFPNLFNPIPDQTFVNVTTPATQFVTFPTPIGILPIT